MRSSIYVEGIKRRLKSKYTVEGYYQRLKNITKKLLALSLQYGISMGEVAVKLVDENLVDIHEKAFLIAWLFEKQVDVV